jgi:Ca2+/Na+ antiporter
MSPFSRTIRFVDEDARPPLDSNVKSRNTIELNTVDPREPSESNTETGVLSDTEDLMDDADRPNRGRQSSTGQQNEAPGVNDTTNLPHSRAHSSSTSRQSLRRLSNQDGLPPYRTARQGLMGSTSSIPQLLHHARQSLDDTLSENFSNNAPIIGRTASLVVLLLSSTLVAICAEFLVNTIDDMVAHSPLSEPFIGLIILPIAGNVAEHITSMTVAAKNKMTSPSVYLWDRPFRSPCS